MVTNPTMLNRRYTEEDEVFFNTWVFPEEDRHLFTTAPWSGGYRWFRSPNVICLEKYQPSRKS